MLVQGERLEDADMYLRCQIESLTSVAKPASSWSPSRPHPTSVNPIALKLAPVQL